MNDDDDTQVYRSEMEAAVRAAVLAEREACAAMVMPLDESLADAIRARGETE